MQHNFVFINGEAINLDKVDFIVPWSNMDENKNGEDYFYIPCLRVFFSGNDKPRIYYLSSSHCSHFRKPFDDKGAKIHAETFLKNLLEPWNYKR
jgi:hypothetical protein